MVANETEVSLSLSLSLSLSRSVLVDCSIYTKSAPTYALALLLKRPQTRNILYPLAIAPAKNLRAVRDRPRQRSPCLLAAAGEVHFAPSAWAGPGSSGAPGT
jgi:hypothetical protein